jgi:BolA protein
VTAVRTSEVDVPALIRERLAVLGPDTVEIFDESGEHAGHEGARGAGGHYRLWIVSNRFAGLSRLERHRRVYEAVADLMHSRIHALAITAYTPDELASAFQR